MSPKPPHSLPDTDDPYVLLDVRPGASADQIRRAYLRRVKVFKPDRYPAEFRRVREAYDRLREQEAWFDAWRQANEVVRQAQQEAQRRSEGAEPGEESPPADDEPTDEALQAEALEQAEDEDEDDRSLERIMAELEDELQANRSAPPEPSAGQADPADSPGALPQAEASADELEVSADELEPVPTDSSSPTDRLTALARAVHDDLVAERYPEAAAHLLGPDALALADQPSFTDVLLETCCALVWAAPPLFDELVARYGDLVAAHDTDYRDGALLHRRTLVDELAGWREEVAPWPQLERFVMLGASLRPPAEAELGLLLGQRAADDPAEFLQVIARATARAPGIAALYVGMAERWSQRYGRLPSRSIERALPTVEHAAARLAETAQHHRWVRWEQLRPLLVVAVMATLVVLTSSRIIELSIIGLMLALWAWRAWASTPVERIYVRVLRPAAASWLWATRASPDELAVAFGDRLPKRGTWAAVLHPGDLSDYPHLLGNDLALLAFSVTAPMIPLLGGPERG